MIVGMPTEAFTAVHVVLSLIGIVTGFIVLGGMFRANRLPGWTGLFVVTTVLTSVTGFLFPTGRLLPSHVVGVISLVVLAVVIVALYVCGLAGGWRWIYVVGAVLALYLNIFVGVVQAFRRVPFLSRLAPTQSEGPFVVVQLVVLAIFVVLGILAVGKFRPRLIVPA
jgi:hypothetical protein